MHAFIVNGHKIIDAKKLSNFLKKILPKDRLSHFERFFVAYKIAEHENELLKKGIKNEI